MADRNHPVDSIEATAARLASLLTDGGSGLRDPSGRDLILEPALAIHPVAPSSQPFTEVWAVDGGQGLVADARCLQVYVTRAAWVCWDPISGHTVAEEQGPLEAHLLGLGEDRHALAALGSPVAPDSPVDINLLRDWGEWSMVSACVDNCTPGGAVLIDGDLQPDWRVPAAWVAELFERADARQVTLIGVTKHTSLSWGGAPLLGVLEGLAEAGGPRRCWWAPVARTRPELGPGITVVVARLDLDARFSFRVDLPGGRDPAAVLPALAQLCDDASFPGYPYPLSVADRLAACPRWVREEVWSRMDEVFDRAGVPPDVRDRAFADRPRLMERD